MFQTGLLSYFPVAGKKYNSYICRLIQKQECGGIVSKGLYQHCLLVPFLMLGETLGPLCPQVTQKEPCITLIDPLFHLAAICAGV